MRLSDRWIESPLFPYVLLCIKSYVAVHSQQDMES